MRKTFEHLLGLNATDALALLRGAGIFDVRVTFTNAPARQPCAAGGDETGETSLLRAVADNFEVTEDSEPPFDPLLEPALADGMLTEARVVGVRDDGRQLIVSRFRVSPRETAKQGDK